MPPVTVPVLNNLPAIQAILQDENVDEAKRVLIDAVTQMSARRWNWRYFSSTCRAMKFSAESHLLAALKNSASMDEIKQALRNYKQQLNTVRHQICQEGNTGAFMRGVEPFINLPLREHGVYRQESEQYGDKNLLPSATPVRPCSSANMPELIRADISNAMRKAGYELDEKSMSYGIAWTALLACVRRGGQAYMERIQYLKQMGVPPSPAADDKYLYGSKCEVTSCPLPGIDNKHQIYHFFDAVSLSMAGYKNMPGYEKGIGYPGSQEIAFPGRVIGGHEPDYYVPVVKHTFIAECRPETFIQFLHQVLKNNKGIPFGVMINYPAYNVGIGFDGNKWLVVDHNGYHYIRRTGLLQTILSEQNDLHCYGGKMLAAMKVVTGNHGYSLNINSDTLVVDAKKSGCTSMALRLALKYGDVNVTTDCVKTIGQQARNSEILLKRLHCKNENGSPALHISLYYNTHPEAITAFIQASAEVIAAHIKSEEQKAKALCELLTSESANGIPGFYMALQNGHSHVITAFIQASTAMIASFRLSEEQKAKLMCDLLASKNADGTPGFFMTLQYGYHNAIKAFIKASGAAIARFSLSKPEKAEWMLDLLTSKDADGTPGFFVTLQKGHSDAIITFIQESVAVIATFSESVEKEIELLYELLTSKDADGIPGFHEVLHSGCSNAITAFIQASSAAISSLPLPEEDEAVLLYRLLNCKNDRGFPVFSIALGKGYAENIRAFIKAGAAAIFRLSLPKAEKAKWLCQLLVSESADGTSGFYMALQRGHAEAITTFIQESAAVIAMLSLPEEEEFELLCRLLTGKSDKTGLMGCYMALQQGHAEAIRTFIKASASVIFRLPVTGAEKAKWLLQLLTSKRNNDTPGFHLTLQQGYSDAAIAFIQESVAVIARLSLPDAEKTEWLYELLVSKKANGTPGFLVALYNGHSDTITAFIQTSAKAVVTLSRSEEERAELLYGLFHRIKSCNKSTFSAIMKRGGPAVETAFTEGINQLPLSIRQKEALTHLTPDSVKNIS